MPGLSGVTSLATGCGSNALAPACSPPAIQAGTPAAVCDHYKLSAVTLTPSLALFGGKSRNVEHYTVDGNSRQRIHRANTVLDWND
jgi:hypothetical protein